MHFLKLQWLIYLLWSISNGKHSVVKYNNTPVKTNKQTNIPKFSNIKITNISVLQQAIHILRQREWCLVSPVLKKYIRGYKYTKI